MLGTYLGLWQPEYRFLVGMMTYAYQLNNYTSIWLPSQVGGDVACFVKRKHITLWVTPSLATQARRRSNHEELKANSLCSTGQLLVFI